MRPSALVAIVLVLVAGVFACALDEGAPSTAPKTIEALQAPVKLPATPVLTRGTPVHLKLLDTVRVQDARPGDKVQFAVTNKVWFGTILLIPEGAIVEGVVQRVEMPRRMSRGSHLEIAVKSVSMLNNAEVALQGEPKFKGDGPKSTGYTEDVSVVAGQATFGLGWAVAQPVIVTMFFAQKGKVHDAPAGARTIAYVSNDVPLDLASLRALPANANRPITGVAHVHFLRPALGMFADVYCNGIPISKLRRNHRLDMDVPQGYYRFSLSAKHPVEAFLNSGEDYYFAWTFNAGGFSSKLMPYDSEWGSEELSSFKTVEKKDYFNDTNKCTPLAVETSTQ